MIFGEWWSNFRESVEAFSTKSGMVLEEKWKNIRNRVERFSETCRGIFGKEWSVFRLLERRQITAHF